MIRDEQYTPADMASQAAQGWRDGYAAAKAKACPEGYVMVPVEPTPEMLVAINWPNDPAGYRAMLAAAPQAEQAGEPVYLYRRRGLHDFVTCSHERYAELSAKPRLFETKVLYTAPQSPAAQGEPLEFSKGKTYEAGNCGLYLSGIDQVGENPWGHRIEVYGTTPAHAEELRDRVLLALTVPQPSEQQPDVAGLVEVVAVVKHDSPLPGYTEFMKYEPWMADGLSEGWQPLMTVAQHERIGASLACPPQSADGLVEALKRVKMTRDEMLRAGSLSAAHWDNAVVACIEAVEEHLAAHQKREASHDD